MTFLILLLIIVSVYMFQNKNISDSYKTAWFAFIIILSVLMVVFEVL